MEAFLSSEAPARGRSTSPDAVAKVLRGMAGEAKPKAVGRLVSAGVCAKSKAYQILADHPNVEEDSSGKLWWKEQAG